MGENCRNEIEKLVPSWPFLGNYAKCVSGPAAAGLSKDFWPLLPTLHMKISEKTAYMQCNIDIFKIKTTKLMKEVFLESCYGLTVVVPSLDACLLKEDLCLPVPLTLLSDSLADSWVVVVTTQLLSFFHMPCHLAQSSLHPMPVWECSQNAAPSEAFLPNHRIYYLAFQRN